MKWLRDPTIRFFMLGGLLFLVHRLVVGDPRIIVIGPGTKADVVRRFRDQSGHAPTPTEVETALRDWQRDEALYREALREGLDRDDPVVRTVLIDKVRAQATAEAPKREPSDAELDRWFAAHRTLYETPRRYAIEWVSFPKQPGGAREQRETFERAVEKGADPRFLGRPILGAKLKLDEVGEKLGRDVSQAVPTFALNVWQRGESATELLLLRVNEVTGGLPSREELRPRLVVDWSFSEQQKAVAGILQGIVARYRFEESR